MPRDLAIATVFGEDWHRILSDRVAKVRRDEFTLKAYEAVGLNCPDEKMLTKKSLAGPARKKARHLPPRIDPVPSQRGRPSVTLQGDNELVVNWAIGQAYCRNLRYMDFLAAAQETCYKWWAEGHAAPAEKAQDWYQHIYREHNAEADHSAGRGAAGANRGYVCKNANMSTPIVSLRGFFDGFGGKPAQDETMPNAGAGWKYQGGSSWEQIARACTCLGKVNSTIAELTALYQITLAADQILRTRTIVWTEPGWIGDRPKPQSEGTGTEARGVKRDRA